MGVAARRNRAEAAEVLLAAGAEVDLRGNDGGPTVLFVAASFGHSAMVDVLLAHGADVNAASTVSGWTPLMAAAAEGKDGVVRRLLAAGADPTLTYQGGMTAAELAWYNRRRDCYDLLVQATEDE